MKIIYQCGLQRAIVRYGKNGKRYEFWQCEFRAHARGLCDKYAVDVAPEDVHAVISLESPKCNHRPKMPSFVELWQHKACYQAVQDKYNLLRASYNRDWEKHWADIVKNNCK